MQRELALARSGVLDEKHIMEEQGARATRREPGAHTTRVNPPCVTDAEHVTKKEEKRETHIGWRQSE